METLKWIVAPLAVSALAIALWLATPNALAAVWVQKTPAVKLVAANKTKLAQAVVCISPSIALADVVSVRCGWVIPKLKDANGKELPGPAGRGIDGPRELHCTAQGVKTLTSDEYVLLLADGKAGPYTSRAGSNVTVPASSDDLLVTEACLTTWQTFTDALLPGRWDTLLSWFCARNPANASQVDCEAENVKTGTGAEYLDAGGGRDGGPVLQGVIR